MNLFLLLAVPLASVALWRLLYAQVRWADVQPTVLFSTVWAVLVLVANLLLAGLAADNGEPFFTALGDLVVSGLLVPGVLVVVHLWPRLAPKAPRTPFQRQTDIGLLLAVVLTLLGVGDWLATDRQSGPWELFLLPGWRLVLLVGVPWVVGRLVGDKPWRLRAALAALAAGQALLHLLWLVGWGWLVAPLEALLGASALLTALGWKPEHLLRRRPTQAAPEAGTAASTDVTEADPPARP